MKNVLCRFESDFVAGGAEEKDFWHPSTDISMKMFESKEEGTCPDFPHSRCVPILILKGVLCSHREINKYSHISGLNDLLRLGRPFNYDGCYCPSPLCAEEKQLSQQVVESLLKAP